MTDISDYIIKIPVYEGATLLDEVELKGHTVFLSPPGCCAQTTLPYWAKVTGNIKNTSKRELLVKAEVRLMDENRVTINTYYDVIALDEGSQAAFEVKLVEYNKNIKKYAIEIKEIGEDEF